MAVISLRVLCSNCGGDELLSRLVEGTTACPWCGLSFDDQYTPPGQVRPILLRVFGTADGATRETLQEWNR